MNNITFVIPFASHHEMIVERAVDSVRKQSVPCDYLVLRDVDGRGPGHMRNRGLEKTHSEYIAFLDADDTVAPNFAEECLQVITPNHLVYTDWHDGRGAYGRAPTPCKVWTEKTFHLVTTLLHTDDVRRIGGFDEALPGAEDTDFGLRLRLSGVCGTHIAQALVMYQPGGVRSNTLRNSPVDMQIQQYFSQRYGGYTLMGCCNADYSTPLPLNEKQAGDVLVVANWAGNRPFVGPITGRHYVVRVGNFRSFWIAKEDVDATQSYWRQPSKEETQRTVLMPQYQAQPAAASTEGNGLQYVANAIFGGGQPQQPVSQPIEYKPQAPGRKKSDVVASAQEWTKIEGSDLK